MEQVGKIRGANGRMWPERRLTSEERRERSGEIRRMRRAGRSIRSIAEELDCSRGTVHAVIKMLREEEKP